MNFTKTILVVLAAILVIGGFYVMTLFSPGVVEDPTFMSVGSDKENSQLLLESEKLEKEFEEKSVKFGYTETVMELLRNAIVYQEVYIDRATTRDRAPTERLVRLRKRLQNIQAKPLSELVDSLEKQAQAAEAAEDIVEAQKLYSEAYSTQNQINLECPLSQYKSVQRALAFDNRANLMKARPIWLKSVAAEKRAKEAIELQNWDAARDEFEKAIAFLTKINSEFPNSAYTDFSRLQGLDIELESLKSASLYMKLESAVKKAEQAKSKKDFPLAAEAYGDAVEYQRTINKIYPRSRHASDENLAKLEREKTDAFSWDSANAILVLEARLNAFIKKGDVKSVMEISSNLLNKAEQFKADYPKSELIEQNIILKLRYINFMGREMPLVQSLVRDNLLPVGGGAKMLKTEVAQKLYTLVMKENPSRESDNELKPVDSVSYDDVERFCTRLSWLLGETVSLPTEAQFAAAVGSMRYADLNELSWNSQNSGGATHPVATKKPNDKGFFDLLGNVEEFTQRNPDSDTVLVLGGGAQTSTDAILDMAKKRVDTKTRTRTLGFRIVVK
mgnify:FL=1